MVLINLDRYKKSYMKDNMEGCNKIKSAQVSLGILRLDYDYPPAPGDIDCEETFDYDVYYRVIPGLTFEMCQSGNISDTVKKSITKAVKWLECKEVSGITGDCGFMIHIQKIVRDLTSLPVFMSALIQLPLLIKSYGENEKIAILTANGESLHAMKELIYELCNVEISSERLIIVGCEDVDGFEAVALGEKVDTKIVEPNIVKKVNQLLENNQSIKCFLMECTELPPYSDAVRKYTRLPVFDSITCADFMISGVKDNPRFGLNNWQEKWDQEQEHYKFGDNLSNSEKALLKNKIQTDEDTNKADGSFNIWMCGITELFCGVV